MIGTKRKGLIFLAVAFMAVLILAQVAGSGTQTKPSPSPAGPPNKLCDYDGNCEPGETDMKTTRQWCPDCEPKTYSSLNIRSYPQVVSRGMWDYAFSRDKVFYYLGSDADSDTVGEYRDVWASTALPPLLRSVCAADADNDDVKEIVAASTIFSHRTHQGGETVNYYYTQIYLFEFGSSGTPSWTSPLFDLGPGRAGDVGDIDVGDVDTDGRNEVVVLKGHHVSVYEISSSGETYSYIQEYLDFCPDYSSVVFSIHLGDADNCGLIEIVLAMFDVGAPIIWKFDPASQSWSSKTAEPVPPKYWNPKFSDPWIAIDTARVRDADNVPGNEIVSGGNNNRLIIWQHDPGTGDYDIVFISDDLGGFTQGVDAGDIDGDGLNEVVVGDEGSTLPSPQLHIYRYINGTYVETSTVGNAWTGFLRIGDVDQDGIGEVILSSRGIAIFEWIGGGLVQTFANVWGFGGETD